LLAPPLDGAPLAPPFAAPPDVSGDPPVAVDGVPPALAENPPAEDPPGPTNVEPPTPDPTSPPDAEGAPPFALVNPPVTPVDPPLPVFVPLLLEQLHARSVARSIPIFVFVIFCQACRSRPERARAMQQKRRECSQNPEHDCQIPALRCRIMMAPRALSEAKHRSNDRKGTFPR
jgi:hypothetical protein